MTTAASARAERERHRGMGADLQTYPVWRVATHERRVASTCRRRKREARVRRWRDTPESVANRCTSPRRAARPRNTGGRPDAAPPLRFRAVTPEMARPLLSEESPVGNGRRAAGNERVYR